MHILAHMFSIEDPFLEVKFPGHGEWHPQLDWCVQVAFQNACISYSPISNVGVWFPARLPPPKKNTTHFQLFFPMVKLTHYLKEKNKSRDTEKHKEENKDHSKFTTQT